MIVTSAGLGDAGPFRRGGTSVGRGVVALVAIGGGDVGRGVVALVAIGDGADAEHAHGRCSPWVEGDLRHDVGGCTRRLHPRHLHRRDHRHRHKRERALSMRAPLRGERPAMARTRRAGRMAAEFLERRSDGAQSADVAGAKRGGTGLSARTRFSGAHADVPAHRPTLMTPVVKHDESGRSRIGDRPLSWMRAATRPVPA